MWAMRWRDSARVRVGMRVGVLACWREQAACRYGAATAACLNNIASMGEGTVGTARVVSWGVVCLRRVPACLPALLPTNPPPPRDTQPKQSKAVEAQANRHDRLAVGVLLLGALPTHLLDPRNRTWAAGRPGGRAKHTQTGPLGGDTVAVLCCAVLSWGLWCFVADPPPFGAWRWTITTRPDTLGVVDKYAKIRWGDGGEGGNSTPHCVAREGSFVHTERDLDHRLLRCRALRGTTQRRRCAARSHRAACSERGTSRHARHGAMPR